MRFLIILGFTFKKLPPCQKVLQNKINRTIAVTRMIKSCNNNQISLPEAADGYFLDANEKFVIKYFPGMPYPEDIEFVLIEDEDGDDAEKMENEMERERNSSDDEDYSDGENHDEDVDWFE